MLISFLSVQYSVLIRYIFSNLFCCDVIERDLGPDSSDLGSNPGPATLDLGEIRKSQQPDVKTRQYTSHHRAVGASDSSHIGARPE